MYDHSFNYVTFTKELRKSDFNKYKRLRDPIYKNGVILNSVVSVAGDFSVYSPLAYTVIRGKNVYRTAKFHDELILRKVNRNIRVVSGLKSNVRDSIVANVKNLLSEGVSYRIYRLDVKSFYESFSKDDIFNKIILRHDVSPATKKIIGGLIEGHDRAGWPGVPRGLALSATITELLMKDFDKEIESENEVFFYSRYVDDIIIITSGLEDEKGFVDVIREKLPKGLSLNQKKQMIRSLSADVSPRKALLSPSLFSFEYLGYKFSIFEPFNNPDLKKGQHFREVLLDIADSKVKKIKTRISKALLDYVKNKDFSLLILRFKFLTSNFSVLDVDRDRKRLAGIYYNYHRVDVDFSRALLDLDSYLRKAVLSSSGKLFEEFFCNTTLAQRRILLKFSFLRGYKRKVFMHFSRENMKLIQGCWAYA